MKRCLFLTKLSWVPSNNIEKIIQNLDLNKAHGHDKTSIRIIKFCGK